MGFVDFVVKYDPDKDTPEDLSKRIIYSLTISRLKANKPCVWFVGGDSGEGKSTSVLKLMEVILSLQGLALKDYVRDVNIHTPIEYPEKLDKILGLSNDKAENKRLRKVNVLCMHEAREVIKAKMWHSFLNQAIGDVNAMSRSIKRLVTFIVSQFIRDISSDIRYTITIYSKVFRPKGKRARLYVSMMWKDDRDLEKPRLRKRKLMGYIIMPNGKYRKYIPDYLELSLPDKEVVKQFEKDDFESKSVIIRKKIDRLVAEMKTELEAENSKVAAMVEYYSKNIDNLSLIGKRRGKNFSVNQDVKNIHGLTDFEFREFGSKLNEKLRGLKLESKEARENAEGFEEDDLNGE